MLNKEEVESIIRAYLRKEGNLQISPSALQKTFESQQKYYQEVEESQSIAEYVCQEYDYFLYEFCEHEDYTIETDEDLQGREFRYAYCPYCGKTGSISESESEDGKEQIITWEQLV